MLETFNNGKDDLKTRNIDKILVQAETSNSKKICITKYDSNGK